MGLHLFKWVGTHEESIYNNACSFCSYIIFKSQMLQGFENQIFIETGTDNSMIMENWRHMLNDLPSNTNFDRLV